MANNGREQKLEFIKWCLGGGGVILVAVILLSFMQEFIKRKFRAWKAKKNRRPPICSSENFKTQEDPEAAEASIRNSLVIKKFECDVDHTEDPTLRASDISMNILSSSSTLDSPRDIEESNSKEGSITESSSEEEAAPQRPSARRSLSNVFRASLSNLSEPAPTAIKKTASEEQVCKICNLPFQNGDDVCESNNPRCDHIFHQHCVTSWLTYQNTCPCCSETFVVLTM